MRILDVHKIGGEIVEIEDGPYEFWYIFYRYGPDNWTVLMGESQEPCYGDAVELLEAAYQDYIKEGSKNAS